MWDQESHYILKNKQPIITQHRFCLPILYVNYPPFKISFGTSRFKLEIEGHLEWRKVNTQIIYSASLKQNAK
jgi:hypothetical protein